jgi:hypothetical protein
MAPTKQTMNTIKKYFRYIYGIKLIGKSDEVYRSYDIQTTWDTLFLKIQETFRVI